MMTLIDDDARGATSLPHEMHGWRDMRYRAMAAASRWDDEFADDIDITMILMRARLIDEGAIV